MLVELGKRIRQLRKSQGFSQEKLPNRADLHYTYIGAVARGERSRSLQSIKKIAKGLDINITELFPKHYLPKVD